MILRLGIKDMKFETVVHEISLDKVIDYYLQSLKVVREDAKEVSRIPYVDIRKNKLIVVVGLEKDGK
jgi:hypothetical protein